MAGTFTALHFHIVFSTKDRRPFITGDIQERLYEYMGGIVRSATDNQGCALRIGGMIDHLHLLARCPPKIAISDLVRIAKSKSSGWIHETFPDRETFAWQEGYGAFTVSQSEIARVANYIDCQEKHHAKRDFRDEFRRLLDAHEIDFDESTIWL